MTLWNAAFLLLISFTSGKGRHQTACTEEGLAGQCTAGAAEGYTQLKRIVVAADRPVQEMSYVLSKDTDYQINLCNAEGKPMAARLTVSDAYRQTLFTNYDKRGKRYLARMAYASQSTGVVHLKLELESKEKPCTLLTLSFRPL